MCKYLSYVLPGGNTPIKLPLIHTKLQSGPNALRTVGLVDSGSTTTFIPTELAEILSLPKVKDDTAVGAGGRFNTYIAKLDSLSLLKGSDPFEVFNDIKVHVPKATDAIPYVVLGRDCLFRRLQVTFRELDEHVIFRRK